ncbi:hypothetical protein Tco_1403439 [Tanacetum coccineum]
MKPFGCPINILNTRDYLGKFDGKADEGYFVRYSVVSKAIRVLNKRTKIVEETLNIRFLKNTTNVKGNGPDWIFDVDSLTISMNYVSVAAGNKTNGIAGTKDNIPKDCEGDAGMKPTEVDENEALNKSGKHDQEARNESERLNKKEMKIEHTNSSNGPFVSTANESEEQLFKRFSPFKNVFTLPHVPNVSSMDNTGIFRNAYDDEDLEEEVDMNNVISSYSVPDTSFTKFHKDHPEDQVIGSLKTPVQTRHMTKKTRKETWIVIPHKKDEIGIVVKNKARLVAQGHTQEEGINYDEFFQPDASEKIEEECMSVNLLVLKIHTFQIKSTINKLCFSKGLYNRPQEHASRPDIMFAVYACARFQVTPKTSHLYAVKRIFRYLKGQPKLGLWYPRDSPFDLEAFSDSDYARASLDRKSTIGESSVSLQNQAHRRHHFIRDSYEKKLIEMVKIHTDYNVADLLTKAFDVTRFQFLIASIGKSKEVGTLRYLSLVVPLTKVGDEAVHKELGDRMERAATTASSLEAEQDSGGYTPGSDEGRKKLNELMELCTKLSEKVTSLEQDLKQTKQVYGKALTKLVKKVKHLEDQLKSTTKRRKAKVVISHEEEDLISEDPSKQGRMSKTKYEDIETKHAEEESSKISEAKILANAS